MEVEEKMVDECKSKNIVDECRNKQSQMKVKAKKILHGGRSKNRK